MQTRKKRKKKTLAGFIQTHCDKLTPPHTLIYCLRGERGGEREVGGGTRDVWKKMKYFKPRIIFGELTPVCDPVLRVIQVCKKSKSGCS